MKCQDA
jgi:hypothetical protein